MNNVSLSSFVAPQGTKPAESKAAEGDQSVKQAFQKFVAGTFYQQMFKSLRKMHGKPAYMHGGQAEEMFQNQMDMQVAEDLAAKNGGSLSEPLYRAFAQRLQLKLRDETQTQQTRVKQPPANVNLS